MMKWLKTLVFSLVLLFGTAFADETDVDHYKEGQRLFGEQKVAAALEEFRKADSLVPNEPIIHSWIGACLNELGKHAEAKQHLETAFGLLQEEQRRVAETGEKVPPIDLGYYTLLAGIQLNLREFKQAVETINSYKFEDDGSADAAAAKQALEAARQSVKAMLVTAAVACLRSGDIDCGRSVLAQADALNPGTSSVLESLAKESLTQADRTPAETDEDKAKKSELYGKAVELCRFWLEIAGPGSIDAQRSLAKALSGTKQKEGYEEAIRILSALWDGTADPAKRDGSIQLDLALAYAGLEQWDKLISASSLYIQSDTDDPLGQGYCMRSYGQFKLSKCPEAVSDGLQCKNADGTPRPLKYVETCQEWLAKKESGKAVARETSLKNKCAYLSSQVRWACSPLGEVSIQDLVKVISEFKAGAAECAPYLDPSSESDLCEVGVRVASHPLNLSTQSKEELETLRAHIKKLLAVCKPALNPQQAGGVEGGLAKVERALERPH